MLACRKQVCLKAKKRKYHSTEIPLHLLIHRRSHQSMWPSSGHYREFLECSRVWFSLSKLSPNNKADEHHTPSHSESSDYKRLSSSQRAQMSKDWTRNESKLTSRHLQKQREGMLSGSLTNWSEWLTWCLAPPSSKQLLYTMLHCSKGGFTPAVCVWDACVCNVCVACVCVYDACVCVMHVCEMWLWRMHAMHVCDV